MRVCMRYLHGTKHFIFLNSFMGKETLKLKSTDLKDILRTPLAAQQRLVGVPETAD